MSSTSSKSVILSRLVSTALAASVLAIVVASSGCKSAPKKEDANPVTEANTSTDANTLGDSDGDKAQGLQTIHFGYDSFVLASDAKAGLKHNAQVMKDKGTLKIQIEGHCDARGGIQYNLALGEKRANAVKKYLVDLGIKAERITTISYGKEHLLDTGDSEAANAKNRRANFVVTAR